MELIEDLGLLPVGTQDQRKRFGIYECPECHTHFKAATPDVLSGKSTKCKECAIRLNGLRQRRVVSVTSSSAVD